MAFLNRSELSWLVEKLRPIIVGSQVQRVRRRDLMTIVLKCHRPRQPFDLVVCLSPRTSRITLGTESFDSNPAQDTLATWLKSNLRGHRIGDISCDDEQKIVTLRWPNGVLILELFGASPRAVCTDAQGFIRMVWPSSSAARLNPSARYEKPPAPMSSMSLEPVRFTTPEQVENKASELERVSQAAETKGQKTKLVARSIKRLEALKAKLVKDESRFGDPERFRELGELLTAQSWQLERGMDGIELVDYFDELLPKIVVPLRPELTGQENVEDYFKRYRRGQSGLAHVGKRLSKIEQQLATINEWSIDEMSVEQIEAALANNGIRLPKPQSRAVRSSSNTRRPYLVFESFGGERILVGRGGADNHATTFHVAKGNDHWLHVKDAPGAHVIVPVRRGGEPHQETIEDAIALALHYSKCRGELGTPVSHTQRKYVRPIVGGKAGLVSVQSEKIRFVTHSENRLKRLFFERLD